MTDQIPGWYTDPDAPGLVRWHDGVRWTEHTADATVTAPTWGRPAIGQDWFRLSTAVQAGLAAVVIADAMAILILGWLRTIIADWLATPSVSDVQHASDLVGYAAFVGAFSLVATALTGILFILWLHQAHRSSAMDETRLRHGSGWAIAGWFVPGLNLWRPYQVVQEAYRGAVDSGKSSVLVLVWWVAALLTVLSRVLVTSWEPSPGLGTQAAAQSASDSALATGVATGIDLVAAVLAILVVQQVRSAVHDRLAARAVVRPGVTPGLPSPS